MARRYDWWDKTWDTCGGCFPVSPGCANCFVPPLLGTRHRSAGAARRVDKLYDGTVKKVNGRWTFTGKLTALPAGHRAWAMPRRWKGAESPVMGAGKPSLIFVGGMSDLFIDDRPTWVIDRTVASLVHSDHIGLLLTKRPRAMAEYFGTARVSPAVLRNRQAHLWLGFSAERQEEFDSRWADMRPLGASGWTVFVSLAPMLGPIVLPSDFLSLGTRGWAIVSGEQGRHDRCRDMDPAWARAVFRQCRDAGVPLFTKQLARRKPIPPDLMAVRNFPAIRGEFQ
ncbi:MAG TPA: DUF5131 family protein [Xanthobacteraceae bacterium]|nr:DUF5131 family protein [Xanthobacteraceae bacterium]